MTALRIENEGRVQWVDTARCIGIFLVILGHVNFEPIFGYSISNWIYSFHMPLFFFLSGLAQKKGSLAESIKKATIQLLIPYFVFYILTFMWFIAVSVLRHPEIYPNRFETILKAFLGLLIADGYHTRISLMANVPLWFCVGLFWCKFVFAIFENSTHGKNRNFAHFALCLFFLVLAFFCKKICIPHFEEILVGEIEIKRAIRFIPFSLQTLTLSYPIFFAGVCMKEKLFSNSSGTSKKAKKILVMLSCLLVSIFVVPINDRIDMNGANFGNDIFLFLVGSFCGIAFIYEISVLISPLPRFFSFLGKESLVILASHSITTSLLFAFTKRFFRHLLNEHDANLCSFPLAIFISAISLFLCAIPCFVVSKYFPWILGRSGSCKVGFVENSK